jgi:hypothetical protein
MTGQANSAPRQFELWLYYSETSKTGLRWLPGQKWRKADETAGGINPNSGYAILSYKENKKEVRFPCHKIVWYLEHKVWPRDNQINHKNYNRSDNKLSNLEFLEGSDSYLHTIQKVDRRSIGELPRYVSWNSRDKKYQGAVRINGERKALGYNTCINQIHKKAIDLVNNEFNRNFSYEYVTNCNFCQECPNLVELKNSNTL